MTPAPVEEPAPVEAPTDPVPLEEAVPAEDAEVPVDEAILNMEPIIVNGRWRLVNLIGHGSFGTLDHVLHLVAFLKSYHTILNCRPCIPCS